MVKVTEKLTRRRLDELTFQFAPQVVLWTALKLGIFPAIAEGAEGVDGIASATECSTRGIRVLLNSMASLGLLEKNHERYGLNNLSRRYFLPSSEDYVGQLFMHCDQLMKLWLTLPEAVRTGRPTISIFPADERERLNIRIVDGLFQVHRSYAWRLVDLLQRETSLLKEKQPFRILDVAAGSAVWSIPFALKYAHAKVTAVDFAPVLVVARKHVRRFRLQDRYRFVGGDIREIEFGGNEYDVALLGHICHSEGAGGTRRLIGKCFRALRKNGLLLIMDHIADERRKSAVLPLLLALNALLGTEEGDTFTLAEYRRWLREAGFGEVQTLRVKGHSPIPLGLKR